MWFLQPEYPGMYLLSQNSLGWRGDNLILKNENCEREMKSFLGEVRNPGEAS